VLQAGEFLFLYHGEMSVVPTNQPRSLISCFRSRWTPASPERRRGRSLMVRSELRKASKRRLFAATG
jgi:hypothetical protein